MEPEDGDILLVAVPDTLLAAPVVEEAAPVDVIGGVVSVAAAEVSADVTVVTSVV